MDDVRKKELAVQRLRAIEGFYIHAAIYVVTIAVLLILNLAISDSWWVQWPALGWGLGLLGHALLVFGQTPERVAAWRKQKIREIFKKI